MKFLLFPELRGRWSWELRDSDSAILAASAMSFGSRQMALLSLHEFREKAPRSAVYDSKGSWLDPEATATGVEPPVRGPVRCKEQP